MPDLTELAPLLQTVVARRWGETARCTGLFVFEEGHAGLTMGFSVFGRDRDTQSYVLKLAPPGVKRQGNTDVYRQAPLLRALHAAGLPVPGIVEASPDESDLGTPYIVMERLPGRSFVIWEPHASFDLAPERTAPLWRQTAAALAKLHAFDWRTIAGWEEPRLPDAELAYWAPILAKSPEPRWMAAGEALASRLSRTLPDDAAIGIVHGDYQPGNLLFEDGRMTGIIDWELAGIGAQGLDLGWLAMMADARCWHMGWKPHVGLDPSELLAIYEDGRGRRTPGIAWYQALACYRMGSIACLNVRLHRSGRRPDPMWDRFAPSIDTLFARGTELVSKLT